MTEKINFRTKIGNWMRRHGLLVSSWLDDISCREDDDA